MRWVIWSVMIHRFAKSEEVSSARVLKCESLIAALPSFAGSASAGFAGPTTAGYWKRGVEQNPIHE